MKIIVITCDKYAWIIPIFLHFFRKYWPDNPYEIEIITNENHIDGNVFYGHSGESRWGKRVIDYLKQSKEDKFLMFLDDYLLSEIVNTEKIQRAEETCKDNIGSVNLHAPPRYFEDHTINSNIKGFREYPVDGNYSFSDGPVIYQKQYLLDILRDEDVWKSEVKGSKRLAEMKGKWRVLWAESRLVIYPWGGLMRRGKFRFDPAKWALQELLEDIH